MQRRTRCAGQGRSLVMQRLHELLVSSKFLLPLPLRRVRRWQQGLLVVVPVLGVVEERAVVEITCSRYFWWRLRCSCLFFFTIGAPFVRIGTFVTFHYVVFFCFVDSVGSRTVIDIEVKNRRELVVENLVAERK